jgi:hypothetical protein
MVLNEPNAEERKLTRDFRDLFPNQVQIIEVAKVETLGASWNRAWFASRGPLLALWNVDDRRMPESLERQVKALDEHREWALCYGDYVAVPEYAEEEGIQRHTPQYSLRYFRRAFPQGGAFWVYRRTIGKQIGYFDEQFEVAPDLDLSIRLAVSGFSMGRVNGLLGYFTDAAQGLSTRDGAGLSAVERTAIQLRYGIFDKARPEHLGGAYEYRLNEIQNFGEWQPLDHYLPDYEDYLRKARRFAPLGYLRNGLRNFLQRIGLLDWLYQVQRRLLKREL